MGFFSKKEWPLKPVDHSKYKPKEKALPTEPSLNISFFPGLSGSTTASGVTVTEQTSLQLSAVYACVNMIATDIAKLPLIIQRQYNGGWKKEQTYLDKVLRKPNKRDTLYQMLQSLIFNFLISGNGYLAIIRNEDGSVDKLIPVDNWSVTVNEQMNGDRYYYASSKLFVGEKTSFKSEEGAMRVFREEDMIHIQNLNLNGNLYGSSPIQMAGEVFGLGLAAQETAARAFNNGSFFQGYLKVTGTLNKNKQDQVQENWNRAQQSVTNSGKVPVIPSDVDYINTGASPKDLQLLEAREQVTKDVARMYKVPLHRLGFGDSEKAANMEQQERSYISNALEPITEQLKQQLDIKLLFEDDLDNYRFEFDFNKMVMPDMLERYQAYAIALTNGFKNRDEVREAEGNSPLPNGEGQIFLTPTYTAKQDGTGSHNIGVPNKEYEE
ncbi:phage major capsid protein HK97 [Acetobacter tropicalis NBRC 101654]|uniref:Phage major capsid protein HK97 n=1 Tax=Acetobacter tropicalis NBRC 101654 TaxID=749388 RepID=F7VFP4_9PROT|nr:phage portal protein [Acetobacter tropicalis]GAA09189.1 phage major capsid protein HK97 [Acetobacter tropicalis NBRC 101654]